ncbi:MAG: exodeoxyribonuclease VII small subunit [Gammaproteobacteria bacterium]
MSRKTVTKMDFEKKLAELQQIVDQMEQGDLGLEQALKKFEQGINLTRECQTALQQAEQQVQILTKDQGKSSLQDFEDLDLDSADEEK